MTRGSLFEPERLDLADLVGSLLDKGVVLRGEAGISVADIDLIHLDLGVMLVAMETALRRSGQKPLLASALGAPELSRERLAASDELLTDDRDTAGEPGAAQDMHTRALDTSAESHSGRSEVSLRQLAPSLPQKVNVDPEGVENGLARLVLTLIEVLRKVLEHQAIRRMEGGSLSEEEVERLGLGLLRLHDRMQELKNVFGLTDDDLQIDLGPLGRVR
ncbi:MAG TPA: gas vesicle protein GvpJ [Gemmatimonadaceae bacterium]|nr:gas vesicle protein GvpJ [Gemmatimonadaceae bacterium]